MSSVGRDTASVLIQRSDSIIEELSEGAETYAKATGRRQREETCVMTGYWFETGYAPDSEC